MRVVDSLLVAHRGFMINRESSLALIEEKFSEAEDFSWGGFKNP